LGAQTPTRPDTDDAAVQPPPRGRPAAEQPAGSGAPARAGGGADIDEEIADGFEEEGLDDPDEYEGYGYRNSMAMRATDVGSLFSGGALPVAYDLDNPYPRPRQLQSFASHYKPSAAGDFASAEIYNKLGSANQREMCTLVPLASYLHDTHTCLARLVDDIRLVLTDADSAPTRRDFVDVLAEVRTLAKQSETLFEFTTQRVDELEALSRSQLDAAEFDPLYGNERSQSGARSALGETLQRSRTANRHRRIGGAIAAEDVRRLGTRNQRAPRTTGGASTGGGRGGGGGSGGGGGGTGGGGGGAGTGGGGGSGGGGGGSALGGERGRGRGGGRGGDGGGGRGGAGRGGGGRGAQQPQQQ